MPRSNYLSERCKGEIFLKFENMQRTGSFKIRGAFNKLSSLTDAENARAWWPVPQGTTRRGLSLLRHARHRRQSSDADGRAEIKVAATRDYSAEVVLHGENFNDTIAKVSEIVEMEGRILSRLTTIRK